MKAYTDKNKAIEAFDGRSGGTIRPVLFASSSKRKRGLLPPSRPKAGSNGSSYSGCARNDLRMKDQSRRTMPSSQYELHDSAGVGEGWSGDRGRVLSQSHFVAWERPRCELGSNLVIATIGITTGEGHVVDCSDSQRTRKIFAGCPASVPFRGQSPLHFSSRSVQRPRSVGNRPIRHYGLRSLRRTAAEAQIQDPSRQKTGPNTAPAFSRVYPSFPRTREPRNKTKHAFFAPLRRAKGDASAARRGCMKTTNTPTTAELPPPTTTTQITAVTSQATTCPRPREQPPLPIPGGD